MLVPSIPNLSFLCLGLSSVALAQQRECDLDGETSTYSQSGLIVRFDNLCGKDFETSTLDFAHSVQQRRSDCLERCVRWAPLCYGFDYGPYTDLDKVNCFLRNGFLPASDARQGTWAADSAMLNPDFLAQLPDDCKGLGLRGCFEKYGHLGNGTAGLATPTASSSASTTSGVSTTAPPSTGGDRQQTSEGLSAGAKAGIGAGAGSAALIAILCVVLFVLKRVKRKRATTPYTTVQQSNNGDADSLHKAEAQIHGCVATGGLELAESSPGMSEADAERFHEIDGRARHEL
jgi:hypothetical protein